MTLSAREQVQHDPVQTLEYVASEYGVSPTEPELQAMAGLLLGEGLPQTDDERTHHTQETIRGDIMLADIRHELYKSPETERYLCLNALLTAVRPLFKHNPPKQ